MEFLIATCVLLALFIGLAALGVLKEYNVEFTFHPPLFVKIKLTRNRVPTAGKADGGRGVVRAGAWESLISGLRRPRPWFGGN
jgi:hypothetical protein